MSGRKHQEVFRDFAGVGRHFCPCDVLDPTGGVLSVTGLVGAAHSGGFGRSGLVRLEIVERAAWRLVRGRT